ncbi:hypothetical protein Pyn_24248 [Prunus yedoensis var. nudiflora]|uniref:Uncharacterized protein n=1 Tax=Prunus yedoensis var. nudiflora TaxID=2094558 RepID=A0A314YDW1_PRUYE|nr:hypothetical protein Pyn_24248 [Prunus yedoensis var. nudiflora]
MASSNRHWPSMFKSKPANCSTHHQWQPDINLLSFQTDATDPLTPQVTNSYTFNLMCKF